MRFIVFGDSKDKNHGLNEKVLNDIMKYSCRLDPQPEFIVMLGDTVAGGINTEILTNQLQRLKGLIKKYYSNKLLVPVIGNHEVNGNPTDERYEKVISNFYNDMLPGNCLQDYNKTAYYLDFNETRIIILNTFHYGFIHQISKEQLLWFEEIASENKKNKIVFFHSPAYPTGAHLGNCLDKYPEARDALWKVIDKCCIDIVFSGHEHNYSRREISSDFCKTEPLYNKKIYQIITGGGGEKLRDKYKSREGVIIPPINKYHFVVVDIEDNCIRVYAISSKGKIIDEFTIEKQY